MKHLGILLTLLLASACSRDNPFLLLEPGEIEAHAGAESVPLIVGGSVLEQTLDTANPVAEAEECIPEPEICDGLDNDCDRSIDEDPIDPPIWYRDADGDGYGDPNDTRSDTCTPPPGYVEDATDCDDTMASVNPGAEEICNGIDDDCDGDVDEDVQETFYVDADGDGQGDVDSPEVLACSQPLGHSSNNLDCDDGNSSIYDGAPELCNGVDDDCDGVADDGLLFQDWYADADGDDYGAGDAINTCAQPADTVLDSSDCDDADAAVNPGATEVCNGIDDDCDGMVDEGVLTDWYVDDDGDGYGTGSAEQACEQPSGYVTDDTDCDDADVGVNPGAPEVCDGIDNDCDGQIDENTGDVDWYPDEDGDGFGDADADPTTSCAPVDGSVANDDDCDDDDSAINPAADEICDGIDNDCDGLIDNDDTGVSGQEDFYADNDGDSYGAGPEVAFCADDVPAGYVSDDTDCDDTDDAVNPAAEEVCNGYDDDCDGLVDDEDDDFAGTDETWYADADGDGYGSGNTTVQACAPPAGYVGNATDCDDGDADVNPGAPEVCNGIDDDCDGDVDEGLLVTSYEDTDGDGYGDALTATQDCDVPEGQVEDASDCDDTDAAVNPGATEICNDIDDDCDGLIDEPDASDATDWYADVDGDGYGAGDATAACDQPVGWVTDDTDCDDDANTVNPGATELCNDIDDDCDGDVDEDAIDQSAYYADTDGDGYGDSDTVVYSCDPLPGLVDNGDDCDDSNGDSAPGIFERCDGVQNDCDDTTWTSDDGTVTWFKDDGTVEDLTTLFSSGTSGSPADVDLDEDGYVNVCTGDYFVSMDFTANVDVHGLDGQDKVVLDGGGNETLVVIRTDDIEVELSGITFQNGDSEYDLSTATSNIPYGGAVHCVADSTLTVDDCTFDNNDTGKSGAAMGIAGGCDLVSTNTTFSGNSAQHRGSAVAIEEGTASFSDGFISDNHCQSLNGGGAISVGSGAVVTMDNMDFDDNDASYGGAVLVAYTESSTTMPELSMTGCTFDNNEVNKTGGAVQVWEGDVSISSSTFTGNHADKEGGAMNLEGSDATVVLDDSTFSLNTTHWQGAAISVTDGTLDTTGTDFDGNVANRDGGAVWLLGATTTFDACAFDDNEGDDGGAIHLESSTAELTDVDLSGNAPDDVYIDDNNTSYTYTTTTTASCDSISCL